MGKVQTFPDVTKVTFTTTIKLTGNNTGIEIPPAIIAQLGTSKRPPVIITVANYTYRSTVAVMGGTYMVALSKASREAAGLKGGDRVEVSIELDEEPRTIAVPADLQAALNTHAGTQEAFDALSFSKRKEFVRQVEDAKTPETRGRRIANILSELAN